MRDKKSITIRDVARRACVSPATVSRYMNGQLSLPQITAGRIDEAVRELNYQPSTLARNLSLGKSRMLALMVPDIANPFFAQLASAAEREASYHGYSLILSSTESDPDREIEYLKQLQAKQIDGIVFLTEHTGNEMLADLLSDMGNIVLVDEDVSGTTLHKVFSANLEGARLATEYLIMQGHRRIGHVAGQQDLLTGRERLEGYHQALQHRGLDVDEKYLWFGPYRQKTGREALTRFLELPHPPTAIFAASDYMAIGILHEARSCGIRVPHDLSVVGFDGIDITEMLNPPLTTVQQQIEALGREGIRCLVAQLRGEELEPGIQRLPVELVIRDSVLKYVI